MKKFKGDEILTFSDKFKDDETCYRYLIDIKWGKGYTCSKCGNKEFVKGRKWYFHRCKKCQFDESVTAGTLFHKIKFPIRKAFYIIYYLGTRKKGMSTIELSREFGLNQKTTWLFKRKVQEAMKSSNKEPLRGIVQIDEFSIGGHEEGKKGRSDGKKKKVLVAVEILDKKGKTSNHQAIGRAYAAPIDDFSANSFQPFFNNNIDKKALVESDGYSTYQALQKGYNIDQYYSEEGAAFPELHIHIMNIQNWIRGIHHHCSKNYIQNYLNEFHFKFNRRNGIKTIFDKIINRFINTPMLTMKMICELNG